MFGEYNLNISIAENDIEVKVEGKGKSRRYYRRLGEEEVEKIISAEKGKLVICPVEPVNLPKEGVAGHLLIELEEPFIIEPKTENTIYLKYPVEIGIFLVDERDVERIDLFTKTKPKYTLYGSPESGIICRYWKSKIYSKAPEVDKFYEGVLKLEIENQYNEWVEIKKVVLRAMDMKIFYNSHSYMHAFLKILKKGMGEVTFYEKKPKNMKKAIDIFLAKGIKKLEKFVMEWGFK